MLKKGCFQKRMVTDGWVSLDAADLGLIESVHKKSIREGEQRLMLAVLESAVEDFQKYVLARRPSEVFIRFFIFWSSYLSPHAQPFPSPGGLS